MLQLTFSHLTLHILVYMWPFFFKFRFPEIALLIEKGQIRSTCAMSVVQWGCTHVTARVRVCSTEAESLTSGWRSKHWHPEYCRVNAESWEESNTVGALQARLAFYSASQRDLHFLCRSDHFSFLHPRPTPGERKRNYSETIMIGPHTETDQPCAAVGGQVGIICGNQLSPPERTSSPTYSQAYVLKYKHTHTWNKSRRSTGWLQIVGRFGADSWCLRVCKKVQELVVKKNPNCYWQAHPIRAVKLEAEKKTDVTYND